MRTPIRLLVALVAVASSGCLAQVDDGSESEHADTEASALMGSNALNLNALNLNALNLNALNLNALNLNSLAPSSLATLQSPDKKGALARQFLQYAVGCALDAEQSLELTWTDKKGAEHHEVYRGQMGLATAWATEPLDEDGQRWVSACLASRVNRYGVPVLLSSRGSHPRLAADASEEASFPAKEGAFWGNLFAATPSLRSCFYEPNVDHSRGKQRDCAVGALTDLGRAKGCGLIEIVGACEDVCATGSTSAAAVGDDGAGSENYKACARPGDGDPSSGVITVWLAE